MAVLDNLLSRNSTLTAMAVGSDGESDAETGLDRIQVPSGCVNAIGIGACDSTEADWQRAPYSSVGPDRSPRIIRAFFTKFDPLYPSSILLKPNGNWRILRLNWVNLSEKRSKSDLVGFGGMVDRPFVVLSHELDPRLAATAGTSFAAPCVVRMASGAHAFLWRA